VTNRSSSRRFTGLDIPWPLLGDGTLIVWLCASVDRMDVDMHVNDG
jgi:hypothetical protein